MHNSNMRCFAVRYLAVTAACSCVRVDSAMLAKHQRPHVSELLAIDKTVAVRVDAGQELTSLVIGQAGQLFDHVDQIADRQRTATCHVQLIKLMHYLVITARTTTIIHSVIKLYVKG